MFGWDYKIYTRYNDYADLFRGEVKWNQIWANVTFDSCFYNFIIKKLICYYIVAKTTSPPNILSLIN